MAYKQFLKLRSSMSAMTALIVTLPIVVITSTFAYHHYIRDRDGLFQNAGSQLLRVGEGIKGPAETFIKKNDDTGLTALVLGTARGADIELITLYDPRERVYATNKKYQIGKKLLELFPEEITENDITAIRKSINGGYSVYFDPEYDQYCLVMPINFGNQGTGAVQIGLSLAAMKLQVRERALESFLIGTLVSGLMGVSIYFLFHYQFTKRVKSISSAAVKFASGDMRTRVDMGGTDEISYLATSFNVLADEITNWRTNLEEMAASRTTELMVLFEVVNTISQSLELNTILPNVLECVTSNMGTTKGVVVLVEGDGRSLVLMAQRGMSEEGLRQIVQLGQGCTGDVILRNKPIRVPVGDEEDGNGSLAVPGLEKDNIYSALVVPISARGVVLGALALYSEKREQFTDQDEALLATIGNQVSVAVLNAKLYEKTLELAQMDGLTGLANRRYFMERLKQEVDRAERYQTSLSVIMLDLDKFKTFNDTYGHLKGDELLKAFSAMVKNTVRATDIAGRYGGEEFCVALPNTSVKGAQVIAERIRKAMEEIRIPIKDGEPPAGRTLSIGIAEFSSGDSLEQLLARADAALYRAKSGGRNRVEV